MACFNIERSNNVVEILPLKNFSIIETDTFVTAVGLEL